MCVNIAQFGKLGSFIFVSKEAANPANGSDVYCVKNLLGQDNVAYQTAARFLHEQTHMTKPAIFSIDLQDWSLRSLKVLKQVLLEHKMWEMASVFGQLVVGPPGSGKTSYCRAMSELLVKLGRKVAVVNIDPANEDLVYKAAVDISELVTLQDVMENLKLGPNGGLMFCMEFLEENMDWLLQQIAKHKDHYFIFDCPGQVELYTHHNSVKNIVEKLASSGFHLCTVHLVDSHYCNDPGKFIATLLLALSAMLQIELPHVNVLSKVDMVSQFSDKLQFGLDFYTEVLDLNYLLEALDENPITAKFRKLNAALVSLIEDYSLVSFHPLSIKDRNSLLAMKNVVDKASGYIYGSGEERNIQALLSCAIGAEYEVDRSGKIRDMAEDFHDCDDDDDADGDLNYGC